MGLVNSLMCCIASHSNQEEGVPVDLWSLKGSGCLHRRVVRLIAVTRLSCSIDQSDKVLTEPHAEKLNRRALAGREKELGEQHPDTLASVNNLAGVLQDQGMYEDAEKLSRRALAGREKELGELHPRHAHFCLLPCPSLAHPASLRRSHRPVPTSM
jgi:hypothetical protein